ncbi:hypothetical protein [Novosphingobium guangzhouense]|uniref:Uncharacterized protein n=1 Tax=Novosphingobium guangzhouense TaxID=1850347 RepID=A0A2K2FUN2_9SPHN|nr:hypothetical protein [Novosphingobium guangzhouense]PNU02495.1 hypothetical protein A8V01_08925 [Novosphingobium guangzhouense]
MTEHTMFVLPPHPDKCQVCASDHEPELPHNAQSIYYQMTFNMEHGRGPTWLDAMEHCTEEMRALWRDALMERGVDVDGGGINPPRGRRRHG